ncbi:helix-turn-helix transcriptional regulator [Brevundimonas sp. BAL450]|uniref:helix-turn-helix domain-containing protein n=1 Tax=Brevundimonas sp. BAL450 TaxID=1708162 RepID=UPI0018C96FA3|nr:helix-turn-helix transcriptional regulator [Brevundimonas sp. BAL450]MBG7614677.1 helix-turn-helix transcriptional regulator [Brevundimonas sp. BAL450]
MSGPLATDTLSPALDALSLRQWECVHLAATGLSSARIAARLRLSPRTVDEHIARACRTLNVRTRVQAAAILAGHEAPPPTSPRARGVPPRPVSAESRPSCSI